MAKLKNAPESKNFVDLTGVSGPNWMRWQMLNNFLNAHINNKKSLQNSYYNGYGNLPAGKKFPVRPVEGNGGNMILDLLTNPDYVRDLQRSRSPELMKKWFETVIPQYNSTPDPTRGETPIKPRY